jgi:hypothetical protein
MGRSVVTQWGNRRAYQIDDVAFELDARHQTFTNAEGRTMSIFDYFFEHYKLQMLFFKPLFVVKIGGKECYLPPEFCDVEGISKEMREDAGNMRKIMKTCTKNPE